MMKDYTKHYLLRIFITASLFIFVSVSLFAQQEEANVKKKEKPVRSPWGSGLLIDTQTSSVLKHKFLEFEIQHRFGKMNSGTFDWAGIYGPSNIRLGLSYGLFKNFQIGIGSTKNKKYQDVNWKYKILTQTRSGSIPLSLTYFGNMSFDAREVKYFGANYTFPDRISYFNQLIIGRKFSRLISLQLTASYAHFNMVDTTSLAGAKHNSFGVGLAGRVKISPQSSITFAYEQPLTTPEQIKPNLSFGIEIATAGHAFQIFVTNYNGINQQENLSYNTNDFFAGDILIGFNITRLWGL